MQTERQASRKGGYALFVIATLLVLLGLIYAASTEQLIAYLLILSTALLPSVLWLRMGASGIPILPAVASAYVVYFAFPIVTGNQSLVNFTLGEIVRAAATVSLFLVTATLAWRLLAGRVHLGNALAIDRFQRDKVIRLIFVGLAVGIGFFVAVFSGWMAGIGSYFGLVRSISLTLAVVTCFLIGATRANGGLFGPPWALALAGLALLISLSWSTLFLVGGMVFALATVLGYVIVTKRVPWLFVGLIVAVVTVLHAGKAEMRDKYWDTGAETVSSVVQLPGFTAEWLGAGLRAISSGEVGQSILDRASLLQILLLVQTETPEHIDFLYGKTYGLLPAILVPRFIETDKPASQVGMDLLNIRYGLLTAEGASVTAIGWGLVAEAYANFGYYGVIGMGLLVGLCCGALAIWGAGAEIVSVPILASITVMMGLVSLELDFIQLVSSLLQSLVSTVAFLAVFRWYALPPSRMSQSDSRIGR